VTKLRRGFLVHKTVPQTFSNPKVRGARQGSGRAGEGWSRAGRAGEGRLRGG